MTEDLRFEEAIAHAASLTNMSAADIRGWAKVASLEDAELLISAYEQMGARVDVSAFDTIIAALNEGAQIAGAVIPILGVWPAVRGLFAA